MSDTQHTEQALDDGLDSLFSQMPLAGQYLQLLAQAPVAISVTDLDAKIEYVNANFTEVTGYSLEEIKGVNHSLLSYKTTPKALYQSLWEQIRKGDRWQGCLINRRKNGERYLADVTIAGLFDEGGKLTHYMGIHQDVTESHDLQTRLNNQKSLLEGILNAAPVAVAMLDEEGRVVLDNLSYKTLVSDFEQEPADLVLEQYKQRTQGCFALSNCNQEGWSLSVKTPAMARERWFSCQVSRLPFQRFDVDKFFANTPSDYYILTMTETTKEQRRREHQRIQELARMTAESEALHTMQEALQAAIHQIQGPINMIDAAVNFFCSSGRACPRVEAMKIGVEAGSQAIEQLQQALPERPQEARQPVNLNQLVHDVTAISNQRLLQGSVSVQLKLTGVLPSVTGQANRLRVALKQLLDNAIEAIEFNKCAQREIVISTMERDGDLQFVLEDSGPGIDESLKLKIFQPFYSTKPMTSSGCRGVGLSIVQQVISEHRGLVQFHRSSLGGSKVVISLPSDRQGGE
ncbi:nitrogen fixation negative regulator NifL [Aliagarivorans taiwanensis]|uniref:nitrogen fixation negative regulator NifL n=1 Tax=Aliagarivorans taiwanensis TaxID=561966 RepID=UPI00040A5132|nr:nitrogen fixation negative regulator NifL [Aliagarivorans taiwanensis]